APYAGGHGIIYIYNQSAVLTGVIFGSAAYPATSGLTSTFFSQHRDDIFLGPGNPLMNPNLSPPGNTSSMQNNQGGFFLKGADHQTGSFDLNSLGVDASFETEQKYLSSAIGDLNGDEKTDLAMATQDGQIAIFFG